MDHKFIFSISYTPKPPILFPSAVFHKRYGFAVSILIEFPRFPAGCFILQKRSQGQDYWFAGNIFNNLSIAITLDEFFFAGIIRLPGGRITSSSEKKSAGLTYLEICRKRLTPSGSDRTSTLLTGTPQSTAIWVNSSSER